MPNKKAAIKDLRQADKTYLRNLRVKREIKQLIKNIKREIQLKKPATELQPLFQTITKKLDKAAKTNLFHANKVNRLKSDLATKIQTLKS